MLPLLILLQGPALVKSIESITGSPQSTSKQSAKPSPSSSMPLLQISGTKGISLQSLSVVPNWASGKLFAVCPPLVASKPFTKS